MTSHNGSETYNDIDSVQRQVTRLPPVPSTLVSRRMVVEAIGATFFIFVGRVSVAPYPRYLSHFLTSLVLGVVFVGALTLMDMLLGETLGLEQTVEVPRVPGETEQDRSVAVDCARRVAVATKARKVDLRTRRVQSKTVSQVNADRQNFGTMNQYPNPSFTVRDSSNAGYDYQSFMRRF